MKNKKNCWDNSTFKIVSRSKTDTPKSCGMGPNLVVFYLCFITIWNQYVHGLLRYTFTHNCLWYFVLLNDTLLSTCILYALRYLLDIVFQKRLFCNFQNIISDI